jgi:hypothetical protein
MKLHVYSMLYANFYRRFVTKVIVIFDLHIKWMLQWAETPRDDVNRTAFKTNVDCQDQILLKLLQ